MGLALKSSSANRDAQQPRRKTQRSQKGVREVTVQAPDGFVLVVAVDVLVFPASPPVEDSLGFPFQVLYVRGDMNFTLMEAQLISSISRRGTETLPGHRLPKELMELMASPPRQNLS